MPLPSPISLEDVGESALDSALPWDRIAGVPFQALRQPASMPTINLLVKEEGARSQKDPDFKWLVTDIASVDDLRKQKALSLNLIERRAERTQLDAERLARENQRRVALGKPALKALDETDPDDADKPAPATPAAKGPDILLDQAAQIMADVVVAGTPAAPTVVAKDAAPARQERRAAPVN